jgi:hypothetical protein
LAKVTDFELVAAKGLKLAADAHGNNVAFRCVDCASPVLAVLLANRQGSAANKPVKCKGCGSKYWLKIDQAERRLTLNRIPS